MSRPAVAEAAAAYEGDVSPSRFVQAAVAPSRARDLITLTKPEITLLVVLSALAGYALGTPDGANGLELFGLLVGTGLTSAGGAVFNHLYERDHDATMRRTMNRPLPAGRVSTTFAWRFGFGLTAAGLGLLCPTTNWQTATLAIATVLLYIYVYTPLKRLTPANTLVGTIPGALPALGGYVAATGTFGGLGWAVFLLLVVWQMPHFLSLAWMYRKDYTRGGFEMTTRDDATGTRTGLWIVAFTVLTVAASLLPVAMGRLGLGYGAAALALGVYFLVPTVRFLRGDRSNAEAKAILKASVMYVMLLVPVLAAFAWIG
ncbi:MAG: heme o synthase [Bacteroidetes bacterium]|nr:heme o synthase [Bacteroidota bacterium]